MCNIDMMLEQEGRHKQFEYAVWHAKFRPGPRPKNIRTMFRYSKMSLLLAYEALVLKKPEMSTAGVSTLQQIVPRRGAAF